MKQDLEKLFKELNLINENLSYEVKLCTEEKTLKFKQLSTEQFNNILSTIVETPTSSESSFNQCMYKILQDNILSEKESITNLNYIDYIKTVLETRRQCISDKLNVILSENEIEERDLNTSYATISLLKHLECEFSNLEGNVTIQNNGVQINVKTPTVDKINKIEKTVNITESDESAQLIKKLFIKELAKYIDSISVGDSHISFNEVSVTEFLTLINNVPASVINEAFKPIEQIKQILNKLINVQVTCTTNNGENVSFIKELSLDGNLFNF